MLGFEPHYAFGYRITCREAEAPIHTRGMWLLAVRRRPGYEMNEYITLPPGWLDPVILVGEHYGPEPKEGLRRLGYRYVGLEATSFNETWALQPQWLILKAGQWASWHRPTFWLYCHHILAVKTRPGQQIRFRDLRPNLWPFRRGCRTYGMSLD